MITNVPPVKVIQELKTVVTGKAPTEEQIKNLGKTVEQALKDSGTATQEDAKQLTQLVAQFKQITRKGEQEKVRIPAEAANNLNNLLDQYVKKVSTLSRTVTSKGGAGTL